MTAHDDTAARVIEQYTAAVWAQDIEAVLALYAEDARIFDLFDHWTYEGRDTWRNAIGAWFGSIADGRRVRVSFDDARTVGSKDVLAVSALISYAELDDAGVVGNTMPNRLSWTLQRTGNTWLIVHEHTSVPIDGGTFEGVFEP